MSKIIKLTVLKEFAVITVGLFINALAWTAFLIPSEIVGGGVSGIGTLIYFATELQVGISVLIINAILISVGIKQLGKNFGIKTIYSIIVLSVFLTFLQSYISEPVVDDRFLSAIIGGILGGGSIGLIFTQGGSTGGTEIIARLVNKYRNVSPGKVLLYCDIFIIASSYLLFQSIETIVYGYVTMGVVSYVVDLLINGSQQSVQMFIFTRQPGRIADSIGNEVKRGVTFLKARGWYSQQENEVVMVIIRKYESQHIYHLVKEIDPEAFISLGSVMGVYGKGFDTLKAKKRKKPAPVRV